MFKVLLYGIGIVVIELKQLDDLYDEMFLGVGKAESSRVEIGRVGIEQRGRERLLWRDLEIGKNLDHLMNASLEQTLEVRTVSQIGVLGTARLDQLEYASRGHPFVEGRQVTHLASIVQFADLQIASNLSQ